MKNTIGKAKYNQLGHVKQYIVALMENEGRIGTETVCELCLEVIPGNKYDIHHTKYDGATYYDLLVVCRSCNLLGENKMLD